MKEEDINFIICTKLFYNVLVKYLTEVLYKLSPCVEIPSHLAVGIYVWPGSNIVLVWLGTSLKSNFVRMY